MTAKQNWRDAKCRSTLNVKGDCSHHLLPLSVAQMPDWHVRGLNISNTSFREMN